MSNTKPSAVELKGHVRARNDTIVLKVLKENWPLGRERSEVLLCHLSFTFSPGAEAVVNPLEDKETEDKGGGGLRSRSQN